MNKRLRDIIILAIMIIILLGLAKGAVISSLGVVGANTEAQNSVNSTTTNSSKNTSTPVLKNAADTRPDALVTIYVLYNANTHQYLYTISPYEKTVLEHTSWALKSIMKTVTNGAMMYRLYNSNTGEHFYTGNSYEKDFLVKAGWHDEGIAFDVTTVQTNSPVYRLYYVSNGNGIHRFTTNQNEKISLVKTGWKYENIAWYSK